MIIVVGFFFYIGEFIYDSVVCVLLKIMRLRLVSKCLVVLLFVVIVLI